MLLILFSCSKPITQVFESNSLTVKQSQNDFYFENDTIKITYDFWSNRGVMSFTIYNKLGKPIYLDWQKSSFIYNNIKLNYWSDEEITNSTQIYNSSSYRNSNNPEFLYTNGNSASTSKTIRPEKITFIPPASYYSKKQFYLTSGSNFKMSINSESMIVPRNDNYNKNTVIYYSNYTKELSPLKFRNYLAFTMSETGSDYFFIDNDFYISSIKEMSTKHFNGPPIMIDQFGNEKYSSKFISPNSFFKQISFDESLEFYFNQNSQH